MKPTATFNSIYQNNYIYKFSIFIFWFAFTAEVILFSLKKFDFVFPHQTLFLRVLCLLFFIKIILTQYSKYEWITIITLCVLGIVAYFLSDRGIDTTFRAIVLIAASKNVSRRNAFKILLINLVVVYLGTVFQGFTGQKMLVDIRDYGRNAIEARYSFGFSHANIFHFTTWSIIIIFIYLYHQKLKSVHYVLLIFFNFVIFYYTRSRTGLLLLFFSLILFIIFYCTKYASYLSKYLLPFGLFSFLSCLALSIATIIWGISSPLLNKLNILLTGRIQWANLEAQNAMLSAFSYQGNDLLIDMGWVRLIYAFGIIPSLLYVSAALLLLWHTCKSNDYAAFILLFSTFVYMTIEAQQVNSDIVYNYILLLLLGTWPNLIRLLRIRS